MDAVVVYNVLSEMRDPHVVVCCWSQDQLWYSVRGTGVWSKRGPFWRLATTNLEFYPKIGALAMS